MDHYVVPPFEVLYGCGFVIKLILSGTAVPLENGDRLRLSIVMVCKYFKTAGGLDRVNLKIIKERIRFRGS
jgi:hypothetical protein